MKSINHNKRWTAEEVGYLTDKFGVYSYNKIAKELGRTVDAVKCKLRSLKLGRVSENNDFITQNTIVLSLNIDAKTFRYWKNKHGLKMNKRNFTQNQPIWYIKIEKFWEWAEQHKELIRWDKFETGNLGIEPSWVREVRRNYSKPLKHCGYWTVEDDALLESLFKIRKSNKQIAERMNRTVLAVKKRLAKKGLKRHDNKRWTEERKIELKKLVDEGLTAKEIAKKLNRSVRSIETSKSLFITKKYTISA
jgi:DNA-binding CsgD family transcriptional regulator